MRWESSIRPYPIIIPPFESLIISICSAIDGFEVCFFSDLFSPSDTLSFPRITEEESLASVSLFFVISLILPAISLPNPVPFEFCSLMLDWIPLGCYVPGLSKPFFMFAAPLLRAEWVFVVKV